MLKKILTYMAAAATACYLLFAFVIVPMQKENDNCKGIAINISNNRLGTINNESIEEMLAEACYTLEFLKRSEARSSAAAE